MWLRCPNMLNWWRIVFVIYFQRHCNKYSQEYMPWLRCKSLCDVGFLSNIHSIIPIVLLIYLMVIIIHDWLCEWHNLTLFLVFYIDWLYFRIHLGILVWNRGMSIIIYRHRVYRIIFFLWAWMIFGVCLVICLSYQWWF